MSGAEGLGRSGHWAGVWGAEGSGRFQKVPEGSRNPALRSVGARRVEQKVRALRLLGKRRQLEQEVTKGLWNRKVGGTESSRRSGRITELAERKLPEGLGTELEGVGRSQQKVPEDLGTEETGGGAEGSRMFGDAVTVVWVQRVWELGGGRGAEMESSRRSRH